MKILITIALVFASYFSFGQKLSNNLKAAIKADDIEAVLTEIKNEKLTLNDCFLIEDDTYSLLAICIRMEKTKLFNALIANKTDLNKICKDKSPLMYASKYGQLEMAKALVKAGADLKLANKDGKTALDYAIKYEKKDIEAYFLSLKTNK